MVDIREATRFVVNEVGSLDVQLPEIRERIQADAYERFLNRGADQVW